MPIDPTNPTNPTKPITQTQVGKSLIRIGDRESTAGEKLVESAAGVKAAAELFKEDARVHDSMESMEEGARAAHSALLTLREGINWIKDRLNGISVPTVVPQFVTVLNIRVMSGLTVTSVLPFQNIATRLSQTAADVTRVAGAMDDMADNLRDLRAELPKIRAGLLEASDKANSAGKDLMVTGAAIKDLGERIAA